MGGRVGVKRRLNFQWVPLIGRLPDCSAADLWQAALEVIASTFFATMPLWFLPLLGRYLFKENPSLHDAAKSGELFIYAAALSGPLVYIITKKYGSLTPVGRADGSHFPVTISFPYGGLFVIIAAILCIISGFAFTILRNPAFATVEDVGRLNTDGIATLSWAAFWVSTGILFCVSAYRNLLENVARAQPTQEEEFVADWLGNKE